MKDVVEYVDDRLIKRAWLDSKEAYFIGRGAESRENLLTYEKIRYQRDNLRNYIRQMEGRPMMKVKGISGQKFVEGSVDTDWVDEVEVDLHSANSCNGYLYSMEKRLNAVYIEELELIIQFQLMVVQTAANLQAAERKYLFNFIKAKKAQLYALGINISIPPVGESNTKYAQVIT